MSESDTPFRAPVGTHDVWGPAAALWEGLVSTFAESAYRYGFSLIVSPLFEDVGVFVSGIGEASDVFRNETYVFSDRGDRRYALRPEGTASVVRAFVQHHPTTPFKAWYVTPAFRYERPQKGRYRQHHQLGVEAIGTSDPAIDVEVIALAHSFFRAVGLTKFRLLLNSMGDENCRPAYVALLSRFLEGRDAELCDEHQTRWRANPLRVLDCKKPLCIAVTREAPRLIDHLCDDCEAHFARVRAGLDRLGLTVEIETRLVRGFDYYTRTTFEFVSDALDAAQNAVGGGGRYDKLVERLGGSPTGGIGFGSGIERLLLAREAEGVDTPLLKRNLDVFVVDTTGADVATAIAAELREAGLAVDRCYDERSMKAQMKVADKSGARLAVLVGPDELASGEVTIRDLRRRDSATDQSRAKREAVVATVTELLVNVQKND